MPREVFEFSCPCCGKRIELNTRNGKARAVNFEESQKGQTFDDLVAGSKQDGDRRASAFDEAQRDTERQEQRFEDLFDDAKKAAEKDRDDKPPHPFQD